MVADIPFAITQQQTIPSSLPPSRAVFDDPLEGGQGSENDPTHPCTRVGVRASRSPLKPKKQRDDDGRGAAVLYTDRAPQLYLICMHAQCTATSRTKKPCDRRRIKGGDLGVDAEEGVQAEVEVHVREEESQGETQTTTGLGFPST